jgi:hypothetical protein
MMREWVHKDAAVAGDGTDLTAEISGAAGADKIRKEFERRVMERELLRRKLKVTVTVNKTEDITGPDSVYVKAGGARSGERELNSGAPPADFALDLGTLTPGGTVRIEVWDKDWPDADDLIAAFDLGPPWLKEPSSFKAGWGADHTVAAGFDQPV